MNTRRFLVTLLVLVVLVSGATTCTSAGKEDASAAATMAAAQATEAAAEATKAAAAQAIAQATSVDQTPPPATPTAVTAQVPIQTATAAPTQAPTPVTEEIEPQGQRFYLHADGVLAMTPPPSNSRSDTKCLSECTQTWAITLTHPLQGNAYGYDLVGIGGSYNVRLLHARGDQQTVLAEWLNRKGWQGGPQVDALPGDVLTLEITLALGESWQPWPVGSILAYDYGSYSYVTVGTTQEPLPTYPPPTRTPTPIPTATAPSQRVAIPDKVVHQFFAPGPSTAALAVAGDFLWVVNDKPRMLYQLDRAGTPLTSFPITPTGTIRGLAWDGEALRLALSGYPENQVVRLDAEGKVLESFPLPIDPVGLGWNPDDSTLWMVSGEFLIEFTADGRLLQTLNAPIVGSSVGSTWAPDGLWVIGSFCDCYRFGFAGEQLFKGKLPAKGPFCHPDLAFDEQGYLWLSLRDDPQVYQLSLRQEEVTLRPPSQKNGGELALPRPQLEPASIADKAIVHVTNNLQGTLSLSFGDQSAILAPGETWSAELSPGVYTVYASASVPEPIAFSGKELLVRGYEYTRSLTRPE